MNEFGQLEESWLSCVIFPTYVSKSVPITSKAEHTNDNMASESVYKVMPIMFLGDLMKESGITFISSLPPFLLSFLTQNVIITQKKKARKSKTEKEAN